MLPLAASRRFIFSIKAFKKEFSYCGVNMLRDFDIKALTV